MSERLGPKKPPVNSGNRIGAWVYTGRYEFRYRKTGDISQGAYHYHAVCDCGTEGWVQHGNIGRSKSCGCLKSEKAVSGAYDRDIARIGNTYGHFTIVGYEGRNGPQGVAYRFRDNRCGHEHVRAMAVDALDSNKFRGQKRNEIEAEDCNCPRRNLNQHGYWQWTWRGPDGIWIRVLEHRVVMEESIGRELTDDETVHHIDGDRANNRIENLQLRQGAHGPGAAFACQDCGSPNVIAVKLADTADLPAFTG